MFIVKAKSVGDSYGPDIPGGDNLRWIEGQTRLIHEGVISYYRSNPTAWEIVDNDESLVRSATNPVTGGIEIPLAGRSLAERGPTIGARCDTYADVAAWKDWFGRAPDTVHVFAFAYLSGNPNGTPFGSKIAPWTSCVAQARIDAHYWDSYVLDWCIPLCTDSQPMTETIAGTHDAAINEMLDVILAHNPAGNIRIRFGHEAGSPTSWPWSAVGAAAPNDADTYKSAFDKVASLVRAKSGRFIIEWCISTHGFTAGGAEVDQRTIAPSDASWDVMGIDQYFTGAEVGTGLTFERMGGREAWLGVSSRQYGIDKLRDYAIEKGKRLSFPEFGFGAENPAAVRDMYDFVRNPANRVDHVAYWNKNAPASTAPNFTFPCRLSPDGVNNYPLTKSEFLSTFGLSRRGTVTEQDIVSQWLARSPVQPTANQRAAYNMLVRSLRIAGVMSRLDGLLILAAHDEDAARISPILPGSWTTTVPVATGRVTKSGTIEWAENRGYKSNGTDGIATVSGINLSTATNRKMTQNDAHMGCFVLDAPSTPSTKALCGIFTSWIGRNPSGRWVGKTNSSALVTLDVAGSNEGHIMWSRNAADAWFSYFQGAAAASGAESSAAIGSANFNFGGVASNGFYDARVAIVHWGRSLTDTQAMALYNALRTYLIAVGAVSA